MNLNKRKVIKNFSSSKLVKNAVKGSNIQYEKNSIKKIKNKRNIDKN